MAVRADHSKRLEVLEQEHGRDRSDGHLLLRFLEWFISGYGHLVDWDLFERAEAASQRLSGLAYNNELIKLIVDYGEDAAKADPAAKAAFAAGLDSFEYHQSPPSSLDHQDTTSRPSGST